MSKKPNRTKSVPLTFYVTEADSRRIHQKAEACGMSLTQYLTDCAVGKEIVRIDALAEFIRALKAQGNNLNQLTTLANMGRITAVNVREACASTPTSCVPSRRCWRGRCDSWPSSQLSTVPVVRPAAA